MTGSFLFAYHYFRSTDFDDLVGGRPVSMFADSGAFSAYTQGAEVDVVGYGDWCLSRLGQFDVFCNLDVIYDEAQSRRNLETLHDMGVPAIPVFHAGSQWSELERLAEAHPYIGLGGVAVHGSKPEALRRWFDRCFDIGAKHGAGFHGLGVTSWWAMTRYPWVSIDSTSWLQGPMYGSLVWVDPDHPERGFRKVDLYRPEVATQASRIIRHYGRDPAEFFTRAAYSKRAAITIAALSWWEVQRWLATLPHNAGRSPLAFDGRVVEDRYATRDLCPRMYLGVSSTDCRYSLDALDLYVPERTAA